MDAVLFGRYFLEFALLYPGAYLCLAPLRDHLKAPKTTCWIAGGALTALCIGCAALCTIFELPSNVFLLPILIVSFWLLRWQTEGVTVSQTAFLFSISAVMLAVCSLLAVVLNARAETGNEQEANLVSTALLALGLSAVLSVLFHFTAVRWSACAAALRGRGSKRKGNDRSDFLSAYRFYTNQRGGRCGSTFLYPGAVRYKIYRKRGHDGE